MRLLVLRSLACLALFIVVAGSTLAPPPHLLRKGLIGMDRPRVAPGYIVFSGADGVGYMINIEGEVVHTWSPIARAARPLLNGHILASSSGTALELDPASNIVWEYDPAPGVTLHHDHSRLPNGNTLLLCRRDLDIPSISNKTLADDCLLEVTPDGQVVWEWQTADHYDEFGFSDEVKARIFQAGGDWAHGNAASAIPLNTSHTDPRFRPGNILISYRHLDTVVIVDRDTGAIVWNSDGKTGGQHDSKMIPDRLPGGGNILVFDNGLGGRYGIGPETFFSRVVEIDPVTGVIASAYDVSDSGYHSQYFNSYIISSAQRLPNGNTLINEGSFGHFFEIAPNGDIVWEYVSPFLGPERSGLANDHNRVYRAYKVPPDWFEGFLGEPRRERTRRVLDQTEGH